MDNIHILTLYISILGIFIITTQLLYKTIILPNIIFSILWIFCGIFSIYNNLGLVKPSITIHMYILIIVITFNLSYFILSSKIFSLKTKRSKCLKSNYKVNYRLIYILTTIATLCILPNLIKAINIILVYGFNMELIRENVYMSISNSGSHIVAFITKNIPQAIFSAISIIGAVELIQKKYKLKFITVLSIIIPVITFGGRYAILNFIVFYIASYIILRKKTKIKIQAKYVILALIILVIITLSRGLNGMSVFDMIISYFVGAFSYLQVMLNTPSLYGLDTPLMYGYITLGFIFEPIVMALKLILGLNIDIPAYHINIYTQKFVNISENGFKLFNNNTSIIYTFIRDFGEVGIVIGTIFIVSIIYISEQKYRKNNDLRWLFILIYMYSVIINSTMMYTLTSINASLILITIILSVKKIRIYD